MWTVLVVLVFASYFYGVQSVPVQEKLETYDCGDGPQTITYRNANWTSDCEQIWEKNGNNPIGHYVDGNVQCLQPCTQITNGGITVSACLNISLTVLCMEKGYMTEHRIHFHGMEIYPSPQKNDKGRTRYGVLSSLCVLLLVALGVALQVLCSKSHHHGSGNTGTIEL